MLQIKPVEVTVKLKLKKEVVEKLIDTVTDQRCLALWEVEERLEEFVKSSLELCSTQFYYSGHDAGYISEFGITVIEVKGSK